MTQNKVIGLTGNSGCGKGAVGEILKSLGGYVVDCDALAHKNMARGGVAYNELVSAFGEGILNPDGEINRKELAGIVFSDKKSLEKLNEITHSHIRNEIVAIINNADKYNFIVIDAPLLQEAGLIPLVDSVWLVEADEEIRLERVIKRDNITPQQAMARFKNQKPFDKSLADVVIVNNFHNYSDLEKNVIEIAQKSGFDCKE